MKKSAVFTAQRLLLHWTAVSIEMARMATSFLRDSGGWQPVKKIWQKYVENVR